MRIELNGVKDTRKAIRNFAPDLNKELNKELRKALAPIAQKAKGYVEVTPPMRGWAARSFSEGKFPPYSAGTIKSGIGFSTKPGKTTRSGFTSNAQIFNKSMAGAVYETAGRANAEGQPWVGAKAGGASKKVSRSVNPRAGAQFIANLPELTSSLMGRGRLIYRAWAEDQGKAYGAAMTAIDTADRKFMALAKTTKLSKAA
jgi:hypothetical protein